ncbi:DNA mismatch repair protein MutL, partial [Halonotius pteroides]
SGLLRSRAPRGRSAPEQTDVSPGTPDDAGDDAETRGGSDEKSPEDRDVSGKRDGRSDGHGDRNDADERVRSVDTGADEAPTAEAGGTATDGADGAAVTASDPEGTRSRDRTESGSRTSDSGATGDVGAAADADGTGSDPEPPSGPTTQRTLDGGETTGTPEGFDRLPDLRVFGQFDDTYLVAESADGLVLIDQHAADERVNYERLRERFAGDVTTQTLTDPVAVGVTAREAALAEEYGDALSRLGFRTRLDEGTLSVTTVPAFLADHVGEAAPELARDLLGEFVGGDPEGTVESVVDDVLGDLACHPSITGHTSLREGTVEALLEALDGCENPYACPHGRPTVIEVSTEEVETRFERDYPGHGGRRR